MAMLHNIGAEMLIRWLGWFCRWPALERSWHKRLAAYAFCLVSEKKAASLNILGRASSSASAVGNATVAASSRSSSSTAASSSTTRSPAEAGEGTKDPKGAGVEASKKAIELLSDDFRQLRGRALYRAALPAFLAHQETIRTLKGADAVTEAYIGFTKGSYDIVLRKTAGVLSDTEALAYVGLQMEFDNPEWAKAGHWQVESDDMLSETLWTLVFAIVKHRSLTHEFYKSFPPYCFSLWVGKLPDQTTGLARARKLAEAMYAAEERMHFDRSVCILLQRCFWPYSVPVRETLGSLAGVEFSQVTPDVFQMQATNFRGWGSSLLCEDGFRSVKYVERAAHKSKLQCVKRWHAPMSQEMMARLDRPEIDPVVGARSGQRQLPTALFEGSAAKPTVPRETVRRIVRPKKWQSFTRESKRTAFATALFLHCHPSGQWVVCRTLEVHVLPAWLDCRAHRRREGHACHGAL